MATIPNQTTSAATSYQTSTRQARPWPHLLAPLHPPRHLPLRRDRLGASRRRHPGLQGQDHLRAEERRGPRRLVHDRDQHRRLQVPPRPASAPPSASPASAPSSPASPSPSATGASKAATSPPPQDADTFYAELCHLLLNQKVAFNSPVWFNVGCDRLEPNSDAQNWHWNPHTCAIEFSVTGYTQAPVLRLLHQLRATTRSTPSSPSPRPRACSSSGDRAPAPTSPASAAPWRPSPAAAPPPARSPSCAASTPSPASSSPAARPAAPPRWSSSTSTIPTSSTSSSARQKEEAKAWHPHAGRLRRLRPRLRGLQLHLLPERQQLRPRHRRVHARRRDRRHLLHPHRQSTARPSRSTAPATS